METGQWGPHTRREVCAECGKFRRWVAKYEGIPMARLNEVYLAGLLYQDPESHETTGTRTPVAVARLVLLEERDGKQVKLLVPLEAWGRSALLLGRMHAGDGVLLRGKLRLANGTLVVSSWNIQPLQPSAA